MATAEASAQTVTVCRLWSKADKIKMYHTAPFVQPLERWSGHEAGSERPPYQGEFMQFVAKSYGERYTEWDFTSKGWMTCSNLGGLGRHTTIEKAAAQIDLRIAGWPKNIHVKTTWQPGGASTAPVAVTPASGSTAAPQAVPPPRPSRPPIRNASPSSRQRDEALRIATQAFRTLCPNGRPCAKQM